MKKWTALFALAAAVCGLGIHSLAQQGPERRNEPHDQRPNAAPGDGVRPDPGRDGGAGRPDGGGPGALARPDGRGRSPEGVTPEMIRRVMEMRALMGPGNGGGQLDAMRNYLDVFDRYSRLSRDPAAAGVAAVVTAGEILRARGPDSAITYFTKVLPDVKNETVQRAIRLQLIELYKMSGQQDKALEQLESLMTGAPRGAVGGSGEEGGRPRPQQ